MKLITDSAKLGSGLIRCIERYEKMSFAVAWATTGTKVYDALKANRGTIRTGVIGTHFYQTDPAVLEDFVDDGAVRFVLQPSGVFHPKVFLFRGGRTWEAFVGSANLTRGALSRNSEAVLHISDADPDARPVRDQIEDAIATYRGMGRTVRPDDVVIYRSAHERTRRTRERLSGSYGSRAPTSPLESEVMRMSWDQYVAAVRDGGDDHLDVRIKLLDEIRKAFEATPHFGDMDVDTRAMISGLPNHRTDKQGYFGNMMADGYFHTAVKSSPKGLSDALDHIPLEGPVTRTAYEEFVRLFEPAIAGERNRPGIASRLLAMKRPDLFVCISARNRKGLAGDFKIPSTRIGFDLYWDGIVQRIRDARWWSHPAPTRGRPLAIWKGRAALLDAIFYKDK